MYYESALVVGSLCLSVPQLLVLLKSPFLLVVDVLFCLLFIQLFELSRCSFDLFLFSQEHTGLTTTYSTGYG